jgi:Holliday junction resolvase
MSRNSLILGRTGYDEAVPALLEGPPSSGEYRDLVRRLFQSHCVLAVLASGSEGRGSEACRGIAAELAGAGSRVVIVQVEALLRTSQLPDVTAFLPGRTPGVSIWPTGAAAPVEFFQSSAPPPPSGNWLDSLLRDFDAVVLDCPPAGAATAGADIAAMADSAVLVVEARRTTKQQIQQDQRTLRLRGVKLAGCILMKQR